MLQFLQELRSEEGSRSDGPARAKFEGQELRFLVRRINVHGQVQMIQIVTLVHRNGGTDIVKLERSNRPRRGPVYVYKEGRGRNVLP
jgi:hypothetical protein